MPITINGSLVEVPSDPRVSLLDFLPDHIDLPGTKKTATQGACGACSVLADGERILSCLALAVQYEGCWITTFEGLSFAGTLHPLQTAFVEHDGFQCGYCTPGQICLMGARGVGGIGITEVEAAVANAIYNATGKRVRDLPITLDKLL